MKARPSSDSLPGVRAYLLKRKENKTMRRMHTDQEIAALAGDNPIVKAAFDLATKTAETYKTAELVLNSSDFDAVFDAKTTPYETSDPEEPDVINALYNADIIIIYSAGASGTAKEDPHFFRKMRESNYEETAYFECFEMDTGKLYHYEMSVSVPEEGGEITITPLKTFEPLMGDIVDADGHKRFQEWDLTAVPIEGINYTYAKASLSGTHFMMVLCGSYAADTTIAAYHEMGKINLPEWIANQITALVGVLVDLKTVSFRNSDYSATDANIQLVRRDQNVVISAFGNDIPLSKAGNFRIQFDLLID